MFLFCPVFAMFLCASVYMCFVVTCWERADMLNLIIYPLRLNLVYFDCNWQTKCKKVLIAIDYNGHNV